MITGVTTLSQNVTVTIDTVFPLTDFSIFNLANDTNRNANSFLLNATVEDIHMANITFRIQNLTAVTGNTSSTVNSSTYTITDMTTTSWAENMSGLEDGNYTMNFTLTDKANNANTSIQRSFVLDTTLPLVNWTVDSADNNRYDSTGKSILLNVTITEANIANITFAIRNTTGVVGNLSPTNNFSVLTSFSNGAQAWNMSQLGEGNYSVNVTITDRANNRNFTNDRTVALGAVGPDTTLTISKTTDVIATTTVTLGCTASDKYDSAPTVALKVTKPGSSATTVANGQTTSFSYSDTETLGTYTVTCEASDFLGYGGSSTGALAVVSGDTGDSSSSSGGGSSSGASQAPEVEEEEAGEEEAEEAEEEEEVVEEVVAIEETSTWEESGVVSYDDIAEGATYSFSFVSETVEGEQEEEEHSIMVDEVNEDEGYVVFTVESEAQQVQVDVGGSADVDLDADGTDDLRITLHAITDGAADATFEQIGEWIEPAEEEVVEEVSSNSTWVGVLIALLVIFVLVFWWSRRK